MTITADSPYRGVNRLSRDGFRLLLQRLAAPAVLAERDPSEYWDAIRRYDCDPLFIAAMFNHESNMGRNGVATQTRSWGNTRAPSFGAEPVGKVPGRSGEFPVFASWLDGCISTVARLTDPGWVYAGRTTIREIFDHPSGQVWAPAGDMNNPAGYLRAVLDFMNQYADQEGQPMDRPYHVAISYGHNNTDGGNAFEATQTPQLGRAVADACRALGMEVRCVNDEVDCSRKGLQQVAQVVVDWDRGGWPVDLYLETHTEGSGAAARGVFAIYPDWDGDYDGDAERVGKDAAQRVARAVGIPLRGDGTMSERATGVGAQGDRLGIFLRTAAIKDHCTRMIIEFGSHDNADDTAAIMGDLPAVGAAVAEAYGAEARRLGFSVGEPVARPQQAPADLDNRYFPATQHYLSHGFLRFWEEKGGLPIFGNPISEEFTDPDLKITVQYMEKGARFEYQPEIADNQWGVVLGNTGSEHIEEVKARFPDAFAPVPAPTA